VGCARTAAGFDARQVRVEELNVETGWEWVPLLPSMLESSGSLLPNDDPSKADVIEHHRFAISLYVRQIHVLPTKVRGRFFDTDSSKIDWRERPPWARARVNVDTGEFTIEGGTRPETVG
jgi:hypothetical protein